VDEERGLWPREIGLHFRRFATFACRTAGLPRYAIAGTVKAQQAT